MAKEGEGPSSSSSTSARALARVAAVSSHISPTLHLNACSSSSSSSSSSYQRLHGSVPSHPPTWLQFCPHFQDLVYEKSLGEAIAKITINRPEKRNAFRPLTVHELQQAFADARDDPNVGVVILTGKGTEAFCSGGDQSVRGKHGYVGADNVGRLNILDVQIQIRRLPKPVIAMVAGYCVGGGHVLHMVCDITIAADNAVFGQTGPKVGSFDAGYGCSIMARLVGNVAISKCLEIANFLGKYGFDYDSIRVGQKKAREMWFLARFYEAKEALDMGLINTVVPLEKLEEETVKWCREILQNSPTAIRVLKSALNAVEDGHAGLQEMAGNATLLFYNSEEALEGKKAFMEGRRPDFSRFPRLP